MRKFWFLSVLLLAVFVFSACQSTDDVSENPQNTQEAEDTPVTVTEDDEPTVVTPDQAIEEVIPVPVGGVTAGQCSVNEYPIFPYPAPTDDDWSIGPEDAAVTIITYSDFSCPYCALMDFELAQLYAANPDDTRLIYRHFLLGYYELSMFGAMTAEYVGEELGDEAFFAFVDRIFDEQETWKELTEDEFKAYLLALLEEEFGLVPEDFEAILTNEEYLQKFADQQLGAQMFVRGTPYVLINGIPLEYMPVTSFQEAWQWAKDFPSKQFDQCPEFEIDRDKEYFAIVETTKGFFTMQLLPDSAPTTVNSFIFLATRGFYNDVIFHRVMPGFVAQTGDFTGMGIFGPGYTYDNEIDAGLKYSSRGVVGMANAGANTNGSQWFITYAPQPTLDGEYTIFALVTEGMDVVEALQPIDPQNPDQTQAEPDRILSISITEK
jgi:cyclophilin family peptidyl-prolyl cis-trans isomerase/protein-disulfide isomerase